MHLLCILHLENCGRGHPVTNNVKHIFIYLYILTNQNRFSCFHDIENCSDKGSDAMRTDFNCEN